MLCGPAQYSPGSSPMRASAPSAASASRTRRDWSSKRAVKPLVASRSRTMCSSTTHDSPNRAACPPTERTSGVNRVPSAIAHADSNPGASASSRPNAAVGPGR
jgi:hypothetical protein